MLNQFGAYCDIAGREPKMVSCKSQYFVLALSFWGWITCIHVTSEKNSLKPGEKLNTTTLVLSENGYGLGFQTLDNCCYLIISGIGPKYEYWPAWVGNRNQPVDKDANLLLSHSGELKIESKDIEPIILYSSPQPSENTVATLLDTGNFVLQQFHPNGTNTTLWQSFDYPTDNLFPGMKLGVNHKSGHKWSLVSWLTSEKPSVGAFELEWEPTEKELTIKRRGKLCWTSGNLGNGGFMHDTYYMIVSNENESYFSITTFNEEHTRWALLETGQLINRNGADNNVARADLCYGYNTDEGCKQWEEIPLCRHPGDVFDIREGYPNEDMVTNLANSSYGLTDCRDMCWRNCTCAGFTNYNDDDGTGCVFYHSNFTKGTNFASGGSTFYLLVNSNHHKGKKMWIWITVVSVVAALLVICAIALVIKKRKRLLQEKKRKGVAENNMADLAASNRSFDVKASDDEFKMIQNLNLFHYTLVLSATDDFSPENKLGEGGFGPVYKGILPSGQEVAIKRLSKTSGQGIVEFKNELLLICELQHTNLVQLLGYCIYEEERILIYEFMSNKSLDCYLFDYDKGKVLDWKKRFNIIGGISQGLLYLHKYSRLKVIHRDLKASNILLDENMNPKISDFGLARMFTQEESMTNTSRIIGTYGYMSPEYAMEGIFSTKSDVYSFGVLLLEIVSGRRNTSLYDVDLHLNLLGHAWELWKEGAPLQLVDPSLSESFDVDEVKRCIQVGLLCVAHYANDRPTMFDVVSMLTNESLIVTLPQRPAFYLERGYSDKKMSSEELNRNSMDEITPSF
ncbi:G-type lectin S-receptor-like serine/threonine-protein kinase At1g67520 [Vigna radiata var. radiata]|uniref:Receptor-like serine/threonine-protein kinase n=1 Tax=Vigna radiata var. radiata TaxID=3916 RepID=A0A3Q0EQ28_VIGRR|nr:G-type lectin S-receptor-like serine/threonine-protein kinase At1g67520 [Vigna radiata var. radiata]